MKDRWMFRIRVGILAIAAACSADKRKTAQVSPVTEERGKLPGVIVDASWLSEHLHDSDLLVLDARPESEFASEHIADSRNLPAESLLDSNPIRNTDMAPLNVVQVRAGSAGVDMEHTIIIYDGENFREAARVFWVLEVHGHPRVAVLNGGIKEWKKRRFPVSSDTSPLPPRQFIANLRPERLATKLAVLKAMQASNHTILDSRSPEEYQGLKSAASRSGHIKGAINVDFRKNMVLDPEGVCNMSDVKNLKELYDGSLNKGKKIITYCNTGTRASVSYLALRSLGYDVSVYDGSWAEWGNDPELPIESDSPLPGN